MENAGDYYLLIPLTKGKTASLDLRVDKLTLDDIKILHYYIDRLAMTIDVEIEEKEIISEPIPLSPKYIIGKNGGRFRPEVLKFTKKYFDKIEILAVGDDQESYKSPMFKELAQIARNEKLYSKTILDWPIWVTMEKAYYEIKGIEKPDFTEALKRNNADEITVKKNLKLIS